MTGRYQKDFVLAVYPMSRGIAFVVFEGPNVPHDWGVKEIRERKKNDKTLERVKKLVDQYEPTIVVFESTAGKSRRSERIIRFYKTLSRYAETRNLTVKRYTRAEVVACFQSVGATTKREIAVAIAELIPQLVHRLPPIPKIWQSEDPRQSLFDAAALGMTHYASRASNNGEAILGTE